MFYRAWEKPGEKTIPRITTPFLMRYGKDDMDSLYFSWTSMEEADRYHLIVMKDSVYGDTVVSLFTQQTSLKIPTPDVGVFVWLAEPMVGVSGIVSENANQEKLYSVIYAPVLENVSSDNVNFTTENYRAFNTNETAIASRDLGVGAANTGFVFNSYSQLIVDGNLRKQIGSLQFQAGAKLNVLSGSLEMHVGNNFQWNGEIVAESMIKAAQNIIIYYYGTETVYVQTNFAGTIVAPNAEVVIGQAYGKKYYGAIFAKRIVVHQNTIFTWVPYAPSEFNSMLVYATDRYNVDFSL